MSQQSKRLIYRLGLLGVDVIARGETGIDRDVTQERMNANAGEYAPTWRLLDDVLYERTRRGGVVSYGNSQPDFTYQGEHYYYGERYSIGSHLPVFHLLQVPLDELHVEIEVAYSRLVIDGPPPISWR